MELDSVSVIEPSANQNDESAGFGDGRRKQIGGKNSLPGVKQLLPLQAKSVRKVVDDRTQIRCAAGKGLIREEVWQNHEGAIMRYNLAFICHALYPRDNGRVLGYDNAHETHERHFKGQAGEVEFTDYFSLTTRFFAEVGELRKEKP